MQSEILNVLDSRTDIAKTVLKMGRLVVSIFNYLLVFEKTCENFKLPFWLPCTPCDIGSLCQNGEEKNKLVSKNRKALAALAFLKFQNEI